MSPNDCGSIIMPESAKSASAGVGFGAPVSKGTGNPKPSDGRQSRITFSATGLSERCSPSPPAAGGGPRGEAPGGARGEAPGGARGDGVCFMLAAHAARPGRRFTFTPARRATQTCSARRSTGARNSR